MRIWRTWQNCGSVDVYLCFSWKGMRQEVNSSMRTAFRSQNVDRHLASCQPPSSSTCNGPTGFPQGKTKLRDGPLFFGGRGGDEKS